MYAVIVTGGKQYRVEVGTELEVELLDVEPGQAITLDRVLLVADGDESAIGRPLVADAAVSAEVVRQTRRGRSEEHTSELQSLRHLVCRLLLEKKKKKTYKK